jgi:ParB family chromosome partitioning protein
MNTQNTNIEWIDINDIEEPEYVVRDYSHIDLSELKKSIHEYGIMTPLTVREKDGRYQILDGVARYIVAKELDTKKLPCRIISASDTEVLEAQIITSRKNIPVNPIEYAKALRRLLQYFPNVTLEELAKQLDKSPEWIEDYLSLLKE